MKFLLTIKLGNDAMQTPGDLGFALCDLGNRIINARIDFPADLSGDSEGRADGKLLDRNGNTVGTWEVM